MILKNVSGQYISLFAYNSSGPVTGAASTITGYVAIDGGTTPIEFGTVNPIEISSTHMPGVYWQPLAQSETNGNALIFAWSSTTTGVSVDPVLIMTTGINFPVVAPGAANGIFIAGTNATTSVNITGNLSGSVSSVTTVSDKTGYSLSVTPPTPSQIAAAILTTPANLLTTDSSGRVIFQTSQILATPRALDSIADSAITINDALWGAVVAATGKESISGTSYIIQTPSTATTLRTFTLNSSTTPTSRT